MHAKRILLGCSLIVLVGCTSDSGYSGVDNVWRSDDVPEWKEGATTASEVAKFLGPPSQLIPLHDETVFYYMREGKDGKALMLFVWNTGTQVTSYDRAIFIFDKKGILKTYSYSNDALPYEPEKKK